MRAEKASVRLSSVVSLALESSISRGCRRSTEPPSLVSRPSSTSMLALPANDDPDVRTEASSSPRSRLPDACSGLVSFHSRSSLPRPERRTLSLPSQLSNHSRRGARSSSMLAATTFGVTSAVRSLLGMTTSAVARRISGPWSWLFKSITRASSRMSAPCRAVNVRATSAVTSEAGCFIRSAASGADIRSSLSG